MTTAVRYVYLGPGGEDATLRATGATIVAPYQAHFGEVVPVSTSGGAVTITLPSGDRVGMVAVQHRVGAAAVTIDGYGSETVDGAATATLATAGETRLMVCDGLGAWTSIAGGAAVSGLVGTYSPVVGTVNTVATSGAAQTIPEPSDYPYNDITLTAACTLTFPAATVGKEIRLVIRQNGTGNWTIVWPTGKKLPGGVLQPTVTAGAIDYFRAVSVVAGEWLIFREGAAFA